MWRLLYPLKYFSLHNKEKSRIDFWPTLFMALAMSLPYIIFKEAVFFKTDGLLDKIIPLSSALTAFYVAALTAVATFSHPDLDKVITLGSIYFLEKDEKGAEVKDELTRRQFACIIFGYLAFISLIISVAGAVAVTVNGVPVSDIEVNIGKELWSIDLSRLINGALTVAFTLCIAHMVTVTCLGLYYLMERIHDYEPTVLTTKDGAPPEQV